MPIIQPSNFFFHLYFLYICQELDSKLVTNKVAINIDVGLSENNVGFAIEFQSFMSTVFASKCPREKWSMLKISKSDYY